MLLLKIPTFSQLLQQILVVKATRRECPIYFDISPLQRLFAQELLFFKKKLRHKSSNKHGTAVLSSSI
jgi:hypothetical protein